MKIPNTPSTTPSRSSGHSYFHTALGSLTICLLALIATVPQAQAEHRYNVYRSDRFGLPKDPLHPSAVLEIVKRTGQGAIYEADSFGSPDLINGPTYIIESELGPSADHSHRIDDEPCDDDDDDIHTRHRRRRDHADFHGLFDD